MHKVADLIGAHLDAAVAKADGMDYAIERHAIRNPDPVRHMLVWLKRDGKADFSQQPWRPSTDWSQGGPIIEREGIDLYSENGERFADFGHPSRADGVQWTHARGPTLLIAAMRAFVASKFGETVELP